MLLCGLHCESNRTEESAWWCSHSFIQDKIQWWRCLCGYMWHRDTGVSIPQQNRTQQSCTLKHQVRGCCSTRADTRGACTGVVMLLLWQWFNVSLIWGRLWLRGRPCLFPQKATFQGAIKKQWSPLTSLRSRKLWFTSRIYISYIWNIMFISIKQKNCIQAFWLLHFHIW